MSGGKETYEKVLDTTTARIVAMQVLAAGAISPEEAMEYICSLPNVHSILFGASSKVNIEETVSLIHKYDRQFKLQQVSI